MKETWEAAFLDDNRIIVVGRFDTADETDEYAKQYSEEIKYLGAARRMAKYELSRHVAMRNLAMTMADLPGPTKPRWIGKITRWEPNEGYGFLIDTDGKTWFVSRTHIAEPLDPSIGLDSKVTFSGSAHNRPGKKYPNAETVRPMGWEILKREE